MRHRFSKVSLLFLLLSAGSAAAQEIAVCDLETNVPDTVAQELDIILSAMSDPEAPLASTLGYAPGGVLSVQSPDWHYARAVGVADLDTGTVISCDMPFQIGSNTKMMTAVVLLQMQEEGALSLDDPLSKFLPDIAGALPNGSDITLKQLARHTSGVFSYTDNAPDGAPGIMEGAITNTEQLLRGYSPQELVEFAIVHGRPNFAPDADGEWSYSNTGYVLLGMVIEEVDGRHLTDVFRERIFKPLGMDESFLWDDVPLLEFGLPRAYLEAPFVYETSNWNMSQGWAAGAVISTAQDMHVFIEALLAGELFTSIETLKLMQRTVPTTHPALTGYGIGLAEKGPNVWGHGGETLGFESDVAYYGDADVSLVGWGTSSHNVMALGVNAVAGALVGAGVLPDPAIAESGALRGQMIGPEWRLVSIEVIGGGRSEVDFIGRYTIRFDDDGGFAAAVDCNRLLGSWELDRLKLAIKPGPATRAACPPGSKSDVYVAGLAGAQSAYIAEGELTIIAQQGDGSNLLKFQPAK